MISNETLKHSVMNYDSKYEQGLMMSEIQEIMKTLGLNEENFSLEKFSDSLYGNTCCMRGGKIINYFHDVIVALICGSERRDETLSEFD